MKVSDIKKKNIRRINKALKDDEYWRGKSNPKERPRLYRRHRWGDCVFIK